ncbi:hypothetical protein BU17DRAFT_52585 [Hysterangium stoloniferum]|nr:hypothetical protein BU17DRAFT_52585 [Hysterangium stoloniferum]
MFASRNGIIYEPLSVDDELDAAPPSSTSKPIFSTYFQPTFRGHGNGWSFLLVSCAISLFISAVNMIFLSAPNAYSPAHAGIPTKAPSVYLGLETVEIEKPLCRSRTSFPKTLSVFQGNDVKGRTQIHAPGDKARFDFGGEVSAYIEFYVPDYGLENCTLTGKFHDEPTASRPNKVSEIDIWVLPDKEDLSSKVFLDTLRFSRRNESTSRVFYCPSRTRMYFQWHCPNKDCSIQFPLEGVTSMTASAASLSNSGFRLSQYEGVECVHRTE